MIFKQETRAYLFLTALVICGLAGSLITAPRIVHFGIDFPFSNIVFSIMTYPVVDCICELWGKQAARQTMWLGLISQTLLAGIIQLSILTPCASFMQHQAEYESVLSIGSSVLIASLCAFSISQVLDITVYQKIKELSLGKHLWLRSNAATFLGQALDSIIFINIVFAGSNQKLSIIMGSVLVKIILSFMMTPVVYCIILTVNKYLGSDTMAFKGGAECLPKTAIVQA